MALSFTQFAERKKRKEYIKYGFNQVYGRTILCPNYCLPLLLLTFCQLALAAKQKAGLMLKIENSSGF